MPRRWIILLVLALSASIGPVRAARDVEYGLLGPGVPIAAWVEVDDVSHFLGEGFAVTVVVQYRTDVVELRPEALQQASFAPFESTGSVEEVSQSLAESISEYRYSAEVRAISAFPGRAYTPEPISVEYVRRASGREEAIEASFPSALFVASYYGDQADRVPLRPLREELERWPRRARLMALGSGLLVVAGLLLGTRWGLAAHRASREARPTTREDQISRLRQALRELGDRDARPDLDVRARLREVEVLAVRFGRQILELTPSGFWVRDGDVRWESLRAALERRYVASEPAHDDVIRAVRALDALLSPPSEGTA